MKQYVGITRDHSGSMQQVAQSARDDYNDLTKTLKQNSDKFDIYTVVSVVECGILNQNTGKTENKFVVDTVEIDSIKQLTTYEANGRNTPLFDKELSQKERSLEQKRKKLEQLKKELGEV